MNALDEMVESGFMVQVSKHQGVIKASISPPVQGSSFGTEGTSATEAIQKGYDRCMERFGSLDRVDIEHVVQAQWGAHLTKMGMR